jgi:hypothetical protein
MKIHIILIIVISFLMNSIGFGASNSSYESDLLQKARIYFYQSVQQVDSISAAIALFEQLSTEDQQYKGVGLTYKGALYALKGKHALSPYHKFSWVIKGLHLMDEGIALSPNNIEALFIRGSTCFYLPFFFKKADVAKNDLKKILALLPTEMHYYNPPIIINAINFIQEHIELTKEEQSLIHSLKARLTTSEK